MSDGVTRIENEAAVRDLAQELLEPARDYPVVCLTSRPGQGDPSVEVAEVIAILGNGARLCFVPNGPLTRHLEALLPPKLAVFGGAIRIWWPGLTNASDPHDHPLLQDRHSVYGRKTMTELRLAWARDPHRSRHRSISDPQLEIAFRDRDGARAHAERLKVQLQQAQADLERCRERASRAEKRQRELHAASRKPVTQTVSESEDPDRHLRVGICLAWIGAFGATQRSDWPLDRYRFKPEFVGIAGQLPDGWRERLPWVCAMILCGAATQLNGLEPHQCREGHGGNDRRRTRADGAKLWRCALKRNTPGAPRVQYWRLADGTVEFDAVGHHDLD